jgi:hypothetical protein
MESLHPLNNSITLIPTLSIVTSTVSRSVNSSGSLNPVPDQSMGINLSSTRPPIVSSGSLLVNGFPTAYNWNRPPWMFPYPVVGNPPVPQAHDLSPDCAKNVQRLLLKPQDECWINWR